MRINEPEGEEEERDEESGDKVVVVDEVDA